jgi:hypothetical protein
MILASGQADDGYTWKITAERSELELLLNLCVLDPRGEVLHETGTAGSVLALEPGQLMRLSAGGSDSGPWGLQIATAPHLTEVEVTMGEGRSRLVEMVAHPAIPEARIGALVLPARTPPLTAVARDAVGQDVFHRDCSWTALVWGGVHLRQSASRPHRPGPWLVARSQS